MRRGRSDERGLAERRSGGGMSPLESVLGEVLADRGGLGKFKANPLEELWPEVVGKVLAQQSQPGEIRDGRLQITVPNPTWNATLKSMEKRILTILQERCPELGIRGLRIQLGQRPRRQPGSSAAPAASLRPTPAELERVELTPMAQRSVLQIASEVEDPQLRERLEAMLTRQQQLWQWRLSHGWHCDPRTGDMVPPPEASR